MYRERIEKLAPGYDPAHVEGWMRVQCAMLDALLPIEFGEEVVYACRCIDAAGLEAADRVAEACGLRPKKRAS